MNPIRAGALAVLVPLAVTAPAAGGTDDSASSDATAATTASAFPVTIEHKFGSTTIESQPERVVSVGFAEHEGLLALGVEPVGVRDWYGDQTYATWPWAQDELGDLQPEVIPADALNFEQIAALDPELIVGVSSGMTDTDYATLSAIAPTIAQPDEYIEYGTPWDVQLEIDGLATGHAAEAAEVIAETKALFEDVRSAHPEWEGQTVAVAYIYDTPGAYASGDSRPRALADLGLVTPPAFDELAGDQFWFVASNEEVGRLDADVVIWLVDSDAGIAAIRDIPLRPTMRAFREGREIVTDAMLSGAFSHASPLSFPFLLERLVPELELALDGDPATVVPSAAAIDPDRLIAMAPPLAPDVREVLDETVEHFNTNHADTVLLLARYAAGAAEASDAEAIAVDTLGVDFEVRVGAGVAAPRSVARARFPAPAATLEEIQTAVFGLIAEARQGAGADVPLTSLEREAARRGALPTFAALVRAVDDLTPNLREVVISGPELARFPSFGGDQFFYVLVARPGDAPLPDGYTMADWMAADEATRPFGAYYTVRHWNPERAEITLWAVVHGHTEGVGSWFARCTPGDRLAIWGPRYGYWSDGAYESATAGRRHLFVTDESGFAAVASLLDQLPAADTATVLAETIDPNHAIAFPGRRTDVRWSYRGTEAPGVGHRLIDAVRRHVGDHGGGPATAFGAGESRQITAIRRYLRHEAGMLATAVSMTGYWRRE